MSADFEEAKAMQGLLEAKVGLTSAALQAFPKSGPFNLTPDHVKASPEFQAAKRAFDQALAELRTFNADFVTIFAEELRAARRARRCA